MHFFSHLISLLTWSQLCEAIPTKRPTWHKDGARWETLTPLLQSRQEHSVAAIHDRIYVVGGILGNISYSPNDPASEPATRIRSISTTGSTQYFDLARSAWFNAAPFPVPVNHGNLASVKGKLFMLGGLSGTNLSTWNAIGDSYVYESSNDTWSPLPFMPEGTARGACAVGVIGDEIYLAGGESPFTVGSDFVSILILRRHDPT